MEFLEVVIRPKGIKIEKKDKRRFVKNFVKIAGLLYKLTRKEQKWKWEIR